MQSRCLVSGPILSLTKKPCSGQVDGTRKLAGLSCMAASCCFERDARAWHKLPLSAIVVKRRSLPTAFIFKLSSLLQL